MKTEQKTALVKFGTVKPGHEHVHDGRVCREGDVVEMPADLAEFVTASGKGSVVAGSAGESDLANN